MAYLFSVLFQGEMITEASVTPAQRREVERQAFPMTPPRDAASRDSYRAYKIAPLQGGRVLLATCVGGGRDPFGREVLQAKGCVLDATGLSGTLSDLTATWRALEHIDLAGGFEGLRQRVKAISVATAPDAVELRQETQEHHDDFDDRLVEVLSGDQADLYFGSGDPLGLIGPALGLLPLSRLQCLHLALGGEPGDYREPMLGIARTVPEELAQANKGVLSQWLQAPFKKSVLVDFENRAVYGWPANWITLRRYQARLKKWAGWR